MLCVYTLMWKFNENEMSAILLDELIGIYSNSKDKSYTIFHRMFRDAILSLRESEFRMNCEYSENDANFYRPLLSKGLTGTEYGDMCNMLSLWNSLSYIERIHLGMRMIQYC